MNDEELRRKYARQKKWISALYLLAAMLMLSMTLSTNRLWLTAVFALTAVIAAIIMVVLCRCPGCRQRLPHQFDGTCPHCGAKLDDEQKLR